MDNMQTFEFWCFTLNVQTKLLLKENKTKQNNKNLEDLQDAWCRSESFTAFIYVYMSDLLK